MKRALVVLFIFIFPFSVFAENVSLKAGIESNDYSDYLEMVDLTPKQRKQILRIRNEENYVLRPLTLDMEAKEEGSTLIDRFVCDFFDFECKAKLRDSLEARENEQNEALRKIYQKKQYYKLRYRNVLTREQDIKIQQMIKEDEHKEKVLMERLKKQKRQERIDKFKFWKKKA